MNGKHDRRPTWLNKSLLRVGDVGGIIKSVVKREKASSNNEDVVRMINAWDRDGGKGGVVDEEESKLTMTRLISHFLTLHYLYLSFDLLLPYIITNHRDVSNCRTVYQTCHSLLLRSMHSPDRILRIWTIFYEM
jgi:hypothetical protein